MPGEYRTSRLTAVRIVSLCPSLTELVFDLGRGEDLVAITRWCIHPRDGVDEIEKAGGTKNPDVERIVELSPDLILMNREENRVEDAEAFEAAGLRCHVTMPRDVAETADMVRSIAAALERPEAGERIATDIEAGNGIIHVIADVLFPEPILDLVQTAEKAGTFTTRFVRRRDHATAGLIYTVLFSHDLVEWEASAGTQTVVAAQGAYEVVEVTFPSSPGSGSKSGFASVQVSRTP